MEDITKKAIEDVRDCDISFCKYIQANDTKATNTHQSGYHLPKNSWPLFFDSPGKKGEMKDVFATIYWQDSFETTSRFIYYGEKTRNEYRITRFDRGFPFREGENIGDLLVICKKHTEYYTAYIISSDDEIEDFLAAVNITSGQTNAIIPKTFELNPENELLRCFSNFLKNLKLEFPTTTAIADQARNCYNTAFNINASQIKTLPDKIILNWLNAEFDLFKLIENNRYGQRIKTPFKSVQELVDYANTILNRRKSRAGKSLELHLAEIFTKNDLKFQTQRITEDNKKPDFIFPGIEAYNNSKFDSKKLIMLASKTTCKDRWRQILNEADKIKTKHLFTLQQGISPSQLDEMIKYHVQLVVPKDYLESFPKNYRSRILSLEQFVMTVKTRQA